MRPIPVAFHIWFIEIHTYGIGLALTFWFGLRYTERRLRKAGYPWRWVTGMFLWVVLAAIVGARALHVLSNLSYYSSHPGQVFAIWQGGLSSFGGLLFAVPVAIVSARRRCPELPTLRFADVMAPVLMACWGIGRLLGPQLMVAGGGHPTSQWFGMYYAGQVGKRLPVPIFQAMEDFAIFGLLLLVERWLHTTGAAAVTADAPTPVAVGATPEAGEADPEGTVPFPAGTPGDAEVAVDDARPDREEVGTHPVATAHDDGDHDDEPVGPRGPQPPAGILLGVGMVLWGIERFLDEHLWLGEDGHLGSLLVQWAGVILAVAGVALLASRYAALKRWRRGEPVDEVGSEAPISTEAAAVPELPLEPTDDAPDAGPGEAPDEEETPGRRSLARFARKQPTR